MRVSNESLQLNKHWTLGEPLGDGGYGKVVAATGEDGTRAAVKLVPKKPGASRELLFVDLALPGQAVRNVVPVLDSGETEDAYAIVMPLAEESLRDRLESIGGPLSLEQALAVPGHEVGDGQPRLIAGEPPSGVWLVEGPHPFGGSRGPR
jgi:serine/threonine protein kinase